MSDVRNKMLTSYNRAMNNTGTGIQSFKTSARVVYVDETTQNVIPLAVLPAALQVAPLPVFFFGGFDKIGGFRIGNSVMNTTIYDPILAPVINFGKWQLMTIDYFLGGGGFGFWNNTTQYMQPGDLIFRFYNIDFGLWTAWVIISSDSVAYNSLVDERNYTPIQTREVLYVSENPLQYQQAIRIVKMQPNGLYTYDQFYPLANRQIDDAQNDFINMNLRLKIDRYIGLYTMILPATQNIIFEYKFLA